MSQLADFIFAAFRGLVERDRFVPDKLGAGKRFAALVRRETENVYFYLLIHDHDADRMRKLFSMHILLQLNGLRRFANQHKRCNSRSF
jgi:hypothetical protein